MSQHPSHEIVKKQEKTIIKEEVIVDIAPRKKRRGKARQNFDDF